MTLSYTVEPHNIAGFQVWAAAGTACEILFVGKGPSRERLEVFRHIVPAPRPRLSWLRQIHSAVVQQPDRQGICGDGDALITGQEFVALSVVTADCVPIVIESPDHLAVVHAGWRGLAQHIVGATLERFPGDRGLLRAWIGPAIGVCCYEVGSDVATRVADASHPSVLRHGNPRPHLDLAHAARIQLQQGDVERIQTISICTRCSPQWLWSHRRDQPEVGRNWTFAWRKRGAE